MPFSTYGANWMLDALAYSRGASRTVYVSLHTGNPGATSQTAAANEATSGNPAYARAACTLEAAGANTDRTMRLTSPWPTLNAPAGTYTHVGFWDAASSGNFLAGSALASGSETFAQQGTLTLTGESFSLS